jgi:phage terminase large subunit-like protein
VFIPSKLSDNKRLLDADPTYIDRLKSSGPPWLVRAWLDGDWDASAGDSFFTEESLLVDRLPMPWPTRCDQVFAIIDTALKDGMQHDGTAVTYFARNKYYGMPLIILDWDVIQIEGASLENWLPSVFARLEELSAAVGSRQGNIGAWIEDKASGIVLIQQAQKRGLEVHAIDSKLTSLGKEGRALSVSGYVYSNQVKLSEYAYNKTTSYKMQTRNHFLSQVCGFRLGQKDGPRDLLDTFCYGIAVGIGNVDGY